MEKEINLLKHIDEAVARESVRIAEERVAYLTKQLRDDTELQTAFKRDPNSFYGLFMLPYMIKA